MESLKAGPVDIVTRLGACTPFAELANAHRQEIELQSGTPAFTRCFYETSEHAMALTTGQALEAPGVWLWMQPAR